MKYVFVTVFIVVFFSFGTEPGYTKESPVYTHFTFMFQHTEAMHLIINSLAFIGMFRTMEKFVNKWALSGIIIASSFAASFITMYDIPTVGASGMIYSMIGMYLGMTALGNRIKIIDSKKYLVFFVGVFVSLVISYFKENSNFWLHACAMALGCIAELILLIFKK